MPFLKSVESKYYLAFYNFEPTLLFNQEENLGKRPYLLINVFLHYLDYIFMQVIRLERMEGLELESKGLNKVYIQENLTIQM